jgi:hypothetical protein
MKWEAVRVQIANRAASKGRADRRRQRRGRGGSERLAGAPQRRDVVEIAAARPTATPEPPHSCRGPDPASSMKRGPVLGPPGSATAPPIEPARPPRGAGVGES